MDQMSMYAYEALGEWHVSASYAYGDDQGEVRRETIYRGDHVPIDEQDPTLRMVLILTQVVSDLNQSLMGELDILAKRPAHH